MAIETSRNYFTHSNLNNLAWGSASDEYPYGRLVENPIYRGYSFPVTAGETWTLYRTDTTNNRWGVYWFSEKPRKDLGPIGNAALRVDAQAAYVENKLVVPVGATWGFIYLSNNISEGSIPGIVLKKVSGETIVEKLDVDWSKSMQQTFEFYTVDPNTWKDKTKCNFVTACSIDRDLEADTHGSASFDITQPIEECYIRIYLVTNQNGVSKRHPLGTYLVQAPSINFNGKRSSMTADGYTPLIELKEKMPPIGYFIPKLTDGMEYAYRLTSENLRAPVIAEEFAKTWYPENDCAPDNNHNPAKEWLDKDLGSQHNGEIFCDNRNTTVPEYYIWNGSMWVKKDASEISAPRDTTRLTGNFVADPENTWFDFISDLLGNISKRFDLDELGRVGFVSTKDLDAMQPIWTFTDDNSSILDPNIDVECDLFGIPNVVEVIYSNSNVYASCVAENHDPNSPLSIERRGRRIVHRTTDPGFIGVPSKSDAKEQVKTYAKQLLKELSNVERTVSYTHGYCPVRLGDCVRLNYTRADLNNIKARVIGQSISCKPGCQVTEKAIYYTKLLDEQYITVEEGKTL